MTTLSAVDVATRLGSELAKAPRRLLIDGKLVDAQSGPKDAQTQQQPCVAQHGRRWRCVVTCAPG